MSNKMFFNSLFRLRVSDIASLTGAKLYQEDLASIIIERLSSLESGTKGSLSFIENEKYFSKIGSLNVTALFCKKHLLGRIPKNIVILITEHPYRSFAYIGRILYPDSIHPISILGEKGISEKANIHQSVKLDKGVIIEDGAMIGKNVKLGSGTLVSATSVISTNCKIGNNCYIGPGVSIQHAIIGNNVILHAGARIGQDGFGFLRQYETLEKIPQIGGVIIHDNVEIGANTTIDRGTLNNTIIGKGTKIDNLVQVGHNVQIGSFCLIAAQCGIAGSCIVGNRTHLGGRVGLSDHLNIGSKVRIAAASGVMSDIPDGEKWGGVPAQPIKKWFREVIMLRKIRKRKGKY